MAITTTRVTTTKTITTVNTITKTDDYRRKSQLSEAEDDGFQFALRNVMRKLLQTFAISALLLVPAAAAQAQVSFGIQIGDPPPPRAYRVPPRPGPEYVWVEGYQYPQNGHFLWHNGYWTRPPYAGAYWVAPYYSSGHYYAGQWEDGRRQMNHDHHWDKGKQRDWNRRD